MADKSRRGATEAQLIASVERAEARLRAQTHPIWGPRKADQKALDIARKQLENFRKQR